MCGIAGEFIIRGESLVDEKNVVPMVSTLAHRGPDEWGYYVSPDHKAMLLHTRLSIVDLAGGLQPLSNEDGMIWVSFNGEMYDYKNVMKKLEGLGHRFKTRSDTETIVHLYEEYGEGFVEHFRGEFSFALYDGRAGRLYLVRDRFGIKPLYYMIRGDAIIFASEIKAILAHSGVDAKFDMNNIYNLLNGFWTVNGSMFEGIRQVEPGCFLRIGDSGCQQVKYWDVSFSSVEEEARTAAARKEEDLCEEFYELLKEAIGLRLVADVDVGVYLSGGFDSSSIACIISQVLGQKLDAFTIGFEDASYDETEIAKAVADKNNMKFHLVRVGPGELASHFIESVWHAETPVPTSNGTAKFLLSELAHQHLKVVLTGEGSDEMLCGYKQFKHQLLLDEVRRNPRDRALRKKVKEFVKQNAMLPYLTTFTEYQGYDRVTKLFGNYPYTALRYWQFNRKVNFLLSPAVRAVVGGANPLEEFADYIGRSRLQGISTLAATQYVHYKTDLPAFLLGYLGDREEMAHSIEGEVTRMKGPRGAGFTARRRTPVVLAPIAESADVVDSTPD